MGDNKISEAFVSWIQQAYGSSGRGRFTYWNMEVAYTAGWHAAFAHLQGEAVPVGGSVGALREALRRHDDGRTTIQSLAGSVADFLRTHPQPAELSEVSGTPSSRWMAAGDPDPHSNQYNCERAALALGRLTDDELANEVFIKGDRNLSYAEMVAGELPASAYLLAAKDRIRWLSRALEAALAATGKQQVGENPAWRDELVREAHARGLMEGLNSPRPQQVGEVQGDALDTERVLSLADVHAEESREDGVRLLDRGGLLAFAQDIAAAIASRQPVGAQDIDLGQLKVEVQRLRKRTDPVLGEKAIYVRLDAVLALIDGRDAGAGVKP